MTSNPRAMTEDQNIGDDAEQCFRVIFEAGPLGVALVSLESRLIEVNHRLCDLLGYTRGELTSLTTRQIIHPQDVDKDADLAMRLFAGEIESYKVDKRLVSKSGEVVWVRLTATVIPDDEGQPKYGLAMVEDVTEQKLAEQRFEALFETRSEGVALLVNGRIRRFNARFVEMMGRPAEELPGLSPTEFTAPEERPRVAERMRAVLAGGPEFPSEYEVLRPDGSKLPVEVMSQLVEYDGGSAILSVIRDLTDRVEAENALRASEAMFRSLAETAKAAIFIIQHARVAYMNPAAEVLVGLTLGEVNDVEEPWKFIHPDDREAVQERTARRDAGQDVTTPYEYRIIRKTGEERWVEATTAMITFEGKPAGIVIAIDITERVRTQEALRQAREELEEQVERNMQPKNPYDLSFRELVVLRLIADGKSDKEVALELDISPLTAQKHSANILSKMNAASRTEASVRALREGLIH